MSLFNRPAWAASGGFNVDESESNIFSHSSRSYREIVAEQERKRREAAKKKATIKSSDEEQRRSPEEKENKSESRDKDSRLKRRRITSEGGKALLSNLGVSPIVVGDDDSGVLDVREDVYGKGTMVRRSPRRKGQNCNEYYHGLSKERHDRVKVREAETDPTSHESNSGASSALPKDDAEEQSDEDEFAELARRARQQRQQAKSSPAMDARGDRPASKDNTSTLDRGGDPQPPPDPAVQLFISSRIPNTKPLIVHRKLSQRIQEIREVWCGKQGFSGEFSHDVFFIHRMRRVYDVTTCKSLGLEVDAFGELTLKGAVGREGVEKVHLEAVTEEIYQQMKDERDGRGSSRDGEDRLKDADSAGNPMEAQKESLIRLILKAKDKEDFRLKVKPTTLISKIVAAYCKTYGLNGHEVFLEFDGERLDATKEIQSTEVSDMDLLDVHVG